MIKPVQMRDLKILQKEIDIFLSEDEYMELLLFYDKVINRMGKEAGVDLEDIE